MRARPIVIVFGSLLGIAFACKPTVQSAPRPTPESEFPDRLQGFRFTASDSIPERDGGGRLYRYNSRSDEYVTVFVYPIPDDVKAAADSLQWGAYRGGKVCSGHAHPGTARTVRCLRN